MSKYKISVVLPCYKVAQYIERCMTSILNQDFEGYEVIIVNDGSPDNLLEICEQWKNLPNFKILSFPNQGISQARNEGLMVAQGKYIYFLDPDDYIEKGLFSLCYQLLESHQADAIRFGFKTTIVTTQQNWLSNHKNYIYTSQQIINELLPKVIGYSKEEIKSIGGKKEFAAVWQFIYKKDVLINNKIFFPKGVTLSEDKIFNSHFFCYAKKIININNIFYNYFIKPNGLMYGSLNNPIGLIKNKVDGVIERERLREIYQTEHHIDIFKLYEGSFILSSLELCVKLTSVSYIKGYKSLHQYLSLPAVKNAFKNININDNLPLKIKIPIFCVKYNLTRLLFTGVYLLQKLKIKLT